MLASIDPVYPWWSLYDIEVYRSAGLAVWQGRDALYAGDPGALPFTYPPLAALVFVPLALLPMPWAAIALSAMSLAALAATVHLTLAAAAEGPGSAGPGSARPGVRLVAGITAAAVLAEPVLATLDLGQVNLILMVLVAVDLLARPGARWHGIPIGIAVGIKLTPLIFLLVFLVRRDVRSMLRAALTIGAGALLGWLILPQSSLDYLRVAGQATRVGTPQFPGNQSLFGVVLRLGLGDGATIGWATALWLSLAAGVLLVGVMLVLRLHQAGDRVGQVLVAALVGLLVSPISWSHHWVWLVPLAIWLWTTGRHRWAAVVAVVGMSRVMFWSGYAADLAATGSLWERVGAGAYPLLALGLLGHLAWVSQQGRVRRDPAAASG